MGERDMIEASVSDTSRAELVVHDQDLQHDTSTIDIWLAELPDVEMDLFIQDLGPKTFVRFPKLPLELRNMIWRASFPVGRRIKVLVAPEKVFKLWWYTHKTPVTFHVNRESRDESKRRHKCLFQPDSKGTIPPLHFRSSVDSLMVKGLMVFSLRCYLDCVFPDETRTGYEEIRCLELHNSCWPPTALFQRAVITHDDKEGAEAVSEREKDTELFAPYGKDALNPSNFVMKLFPNLETLRFVLDAGGRLGLINKNRDFERCKRDLQAWYAKEKELRPLTKIPEIVARQESVTLFH
ncbi:hypothetical protein N431DRAFT_464613 [Stipitochalara longipes BDJ]|nr:hypothetical protein N431DRAFT_464613 [Stipitochalara longipes BDJ]